jgi:hypothetical protein
MSFLMLQCSIRNSHATALYMTQLAHPEVQMAACAPAQLLQFGNGNFVQSDTFVVWMMASAKLSYAVRCPNVVRSYVCADIDCNHT